MPGPGPRPGGPRPGGPRPGGPRPGGPRPGGPTVARHFAPPPPRHVAPPPPRHFAPPPPPPPRPRYYVPTYTTSTVIATGAAYMAGKAAGVAQANANNAAAFAAGAIPVDYPKFCPSCGAATRGLRTCEYCNGFLY